MALCDIFALERWQKCQPVSVLSLDIPDRTVLKVAGQLVKYFSNWMNRASYNEWIITQIAQLKIGVLAIKSIICLRVTGDNIKTVTKYQETRSLLDIQYLWYLLPGNWDKTPDGGQLIISWHLPGREKMEMEPAWRNSLDIVTWWKLQKIRYSDLYRINKFKYQWRKISPVKFSWLDYSLYCLLCRDKDL